MRSKMLELSLGLVKVPSSLRVSSQTLESSISLFGPRTLTLKRGIGPMVAALLLPTPGVQCHESSGALDKKRFRAAAILAAGMSVVSIFLALLIPRHPAPGHETILSRMQAAPAE